MPPKLLLSFVIDNSASHKGERLGTWIRAFRAFGASLPDFLEWELITFDTFAPAVVKSFADTEIAPVSAARFPLLGRAVGTAIDRIEARANALREGGEEVFRPWMFILSDGFTVDAMEEICARLEKLEKEEKLLYLPFRLSPALQTERLQCLDRSKHMIEIAAEGGVEGFFAFVSRMIEQRAALAPDVGVKFSKNDFEGWAAL